MSFRPRHGARPSSVRRAALIAAAIACAASACGDDKPAAPAPQASASASSAATSEPAPPEPTSIAVVAELVDQGPKMPDCGGLHVRVVMRYRVKRVLRGTVPAGAEIFVVHGCPEMSREMYGGAGSGDLDVFKVGDWHLMALHAAKPEDVQGAVDAFSAVPGPRWVPVQTFRAQGEGPGAGEHSAFRPVSGAGYQGVIVPAWSAAPVPVGHARFTPTEEDVARAEKLVAAQLPLFPPDAGIEPGDVADVAESLPNYLRQYVGYVDKGERVLWINFLLHVISDAWHDEIVSVRGGGSGYFQITVRLDQGRCEGLEINDPK